jgi:hypothetical protein
MRMWKSEGCAMHSFERMGHWECTPNTQCTDGTLRATHRDVVFCSEMKYSQTFQQSSNVASSKVQLPGLHPPWCWHSAAAVWHVARARARVLLSSHTSCSHHIRAALITVGRVAFSTHARARRTSGWFEWRPCLQNLNMLEIITNKQTTHKHESNSNKFVFLPVL